MDLHIQVLKLGSKWSHPQRIKPSLVSRLTSSSPLVPDLSFDSWDLHSTRELFVYILYIVLLDLVVINDTCKV